MNWSDFLARYRATEAAIDMYVAGLPLWVNLWRGWMFFIFTSAIVFVWKREARWVIVTMVLSLFAYNLVAMFAGVGRLPSVAFVFLWAPLTVYISRRRAILPTARRSDRIYRWWLSAVLGTLLVSLIFDVYNVIYALLFGVA